MHEDTVQQLEAGGWLVRRVPPGLVKGLQGPLSGLTYLAKDLFDVAGLPTIAASPSNLDTNPADKDAEAISLLSEAGAKLVGLSNMDPLAYGFVTDNPLYGPARNPYDRTRSCGGSSGGSAGAVASGLVDFALGTDTSGSIRVPAAFTGVFGLKPTIGLLSAKGVAPLSPTLDRVGLFARDAKTLRAVVAVLAKGKVTIGHKLTAPRLGRLEGYFFNGLNDDIAQAVDRACNALGALETITLPGASKARAAAYIIVAHEAAQSHANALRTRAHSFDPQTRARLIAASAIPATWVDAARSYQRDFTKRLDEAFGAFDFLIAPTVPCVAPMLKELRQPADDRSPYLRATLGLYTQPISLTGYPVLSVPIDVPGSSLPTALQVIARPGGDGALLGYAQTLSLKKKEALQ